MHVFHRAIILVLMLAMLPWGAYVAGRFSSIAPQLTTDAGSSFASEDTLAVGPASKDVRASALPHRCRGPALPGLVCQQHGLLQAEAEMLNRPPCGCATEIAIIILPEEHPPGTIPEPPRFG